MKYLGNRVREKIKNLEKYFLPKSGEFSSCKLKNVGLQTF